MGVPQPHLGPRHATLPLPVRHCVPHPSSSFLKIISVDPKGRFIRILNSSSDQDVDMSGYILQQWIGGFPVSIYRFPTNTVLPARHHITVSSGTTAGVSDSLPKGWEGQSQREDQRFLNLFLAAPPPQALPLLP